MSAQPEHHVTRNPKGRRQAWALMVLFVIILLNTNDKLIHDAMECFLWTVGGIFCLFLREPLKKKNVENSTLGLAPPPPMTEIVENFQKKKTKKSFKNLTMPKIRQFP